MAREIPVDLAERSYRVVVEEFQRWRERGLHELAERGRTAAVVTDEHVGPLWGPAVREALAVEGLHPHELTLLPGEETKRLETVQVLYDAFVRIGLMRDGWVVALGGGVIGDLAGFASATYLRGVSLLQVPTSLLAMADSSVGGKVGVDHAGAKNLVGAFHQPRLVLTDPGFLSTLPDEELSNGLAEVVKSAIIGDPELFALLESQVEPIWKRDRVVLEELIGRSVAVKARIVERDEREAGDRQLLNLGHTLGHALEAAARFSGIRHGEAVAVGLVAASQLSVLIGVADPTHRERIERLLSRHRLPTRVPGRTWEEIEPWMRLDKKAREGGWSYVLTGDLGDVSVHRQVPETAVREAVEYVLA